MPRLDRVWCVTDATSHSELQDILWQATPLELQRWAIGGGKADDSLTLYATEADALADAQARLAARAAYDAALAAARKET